MRAATHNIRRWLSSGEAAVVPEPKADGAVPELVSTQASAITPQSVVDIARGNGESLVLWSDLCPNMDKEPIEVRNASRKRRKIHIEEHVQYLNRAAGTSWRFAVVDTIVVRNDEIGQPSSEENQGCTRARDFLLCEVPRERQGVIADEAARREDNSNRILTRNAVGIKKNTKTQTVFSYLSTCFPETFECGNPAIRVKGM